MKKDVGRRQSINENFIRAASKLTVLEKIHVTYLEINNNRNSVRISTAVTLPLRLLIQTAYSEFGFVFGHRGDNCLA